jgi:hypothetical protein
MDPVSLTASIVAFLQLTDQSIKACRNCIDAVENAPKDMQMILGEAISLRAIVESMAAANAENDTTKPFRHLFDNPGPVDACQKGLVALESLLPPHINRAQGSQGQRRKITFAELAWPLKESKARKLLAEITQHKSTMLLAMTGDMM